MSIKTNKVFYTLKESDSEIQLICFPHVGGYWNAFLPLAKTIKADIEVLAFNPPGHGPNMDNLLGDIDELADLCIKNLSNRFKKRVIFFGHSMGAMVAYKIIFKLMTSKNPIPDQLIISASNPPHIIKEMSKKSDLSNEEFIKFIIQLGGIPEELAENREFLLFFTPILKNDFKAVENYIIDDVKLEVPVLLLYGLYDNFVPHENILEWKKYFSSHIDIDSINGGHLYILDKPEEIYKKVEKYILNLIVN